jgi:hypothetical protein
MFTEHLDEFSVIPERAFTRKVEAVEDAHAFRAKIEQQGTGVVELVGQ